MNWDAKLCHIRQIMPGAYSHRCDVTAALSLWNFLCGRLNSQRMLLRNIGGRHTRCLPAPIAGMAYFFVSHAVFSVTQRFAVALPCRVMSDATSIENSTSLRKTYSRDPITTTESMHGAL